MSNHRARIEALQRLADDPNATEPERLLAASKVRELIEKYQIDLGTALVQEEGLTQVSLDLAPWWTREATRLHLTGALAKAVAAYCTVRGWRRQQKWETPSIKFYGLRSDAEFAGWLEHSLLQFAQASAMNYLLDEPQADLKGFLVGMIDRLIERLNSTTNHTPGANALIPLKQQLVTQGFQGLGLSLRSSVPPTVYVNPFAHQLGADAANRAGFGRPLQGANTPLRLTGK